MSGYDDKRPIQLSGPGWENLPDGSYQFLVDCPDLASYVILPKSLRFRDTEVRKCGWNEDRKLAFYRTGLTNMRG